MMRRRFFVGVVMAGAGLIIGEAAGCSGGSGDPEPEPYYFSSGPASVYYPVLFAQVPEEESRELEHRYQEVLATCMQGQGFEYEAWSQADHAQDSERPAGTPNYGTIEWARLYGYEMSTERLLPPELRKVTAPADPNLEIEAGLGGAEATAYRAALGADPYNPPHGDGYGFEDMWPTEGCRGEAWNATYALQPGRSEAGEALADDLWNARAAAEESAEIDALERDWSACMDKSGYPGIERMNEAPVVLQDRWGGGIEIDESDGLPVDTPEMRAHQQEEIAMAVADYTCQDEVQYVRRSAEVFRAADQAWVDEHRAELDALMLEAGFSIGATDR